MYQLYTVVVKNQEEAVEVSADFVKSKQIDSLLLCPGFRHSDVAEIAQRVGKNVAIAVARGDGPSSRVSQEARIREGYSAKKRKGYYCRICDRRRPNEKLSSKGHRIHVC